MNYFWPIRRPNGIGIIKIIQQTQKITFIAMANGVNNIKFEDHFELSELKMRKDLSVVPFLQVNENLYDLDLRNICH